jgi:hypothetical protein
MNDYLDQLGDRPAKATVGSNRQTHSVSRSDT